MPIPSGQLRSALPGRLARTLGAAGRRFALRNKQKILREIEKVSRNLKRLGDVDLPDRIRAKVVKQINREGWMEKIIEARFRHESERSYGGRKWAPLAPSTVKRKGGQHPKLIDTMDMFNAAIGSVGSTFRWNRNPKWNVDDLGIDYAEYNMDGTDRMPARRFFLSPNDREMQPVYRRAFQIAKSELRKQAGG